VATAHAVARYSVIGVQYSVERRLRYPSRPAFSQIWRPTELASVDAEIGKNSGTHFLLNLIHPRSRRRRMHGNLVAGSRFYDRAARSRGILPRY